MIVYLKHKDSGKIKKGIVGYSVTTLFFGMFVPLFRGDFKISMPFIVLFLMEVLFVPDSKYEDDTFMYFYLRIFLIINGLGALYYNKIYTQGLVKKGYYPMTEEDALILQSKGIKLPSDMNQFDETQFDSYQ